MICSTCNDTHWMKLGDGLAMCTRCPVPCERCRMRGPGQAGGAYCASTPCSCECHQAKHARASASSSALTLIGPVRIHLDTAESVLRFGVFGQARASLVCATLLLCEAAGLDEVGVAAVRRLLNADVNGNDYASAVKRGDVITEAP